VVHHDVMHCLNYLQFLHGHFLYDASGYGLGCKPCHKGCTCTIFRTLFVVMVLLEAAAALAALVEEGRAPAGDQLDLQVSSPVVVVVGDGNGVSQEKLSLGVDGPEAVVYFVVAVQQPESHPPGAADFAFFET